MDSQKEKAITNIINQDRAKGLKFIITKQKLLEQGYSEADIVYALYSDPYDASGDLRKPNPLEQYYAQHPEDAQRIAVNLLQQQEMDDWDQTAAEYLGGQMGPDVQSRNYYDLLAADRLGIPYFTLTLIPFSILMLAIKFNWSSFVAHTVFSAFSLFVSLLFAVKLIHERMRIKKMKPKS
ncbi:MAG TPA: hypothetical protein VFI84_03475 [Candidatus Saccharimonadales bacterium]|nr:hypothetical protein [Candidatus Saccharimonadales bacterium]